MDPYQGQVRVSGGGATIEFTATIDDLDQDDWDGRGDVTADTRFVPGNATVRLLEGDRAHQEALAAVETDASGTTRLRGLAAFS
jgi:hypothetical protein